MTPPNFVTQEAEKIAGPHAICDDCWYSCPLSEEGCCDESRSGCTCGRDKRVKQIESAILAAEKRGYDRRVAEVEAFFADS